MKVLIACEESQAVCREFRKKGHESYSCDIEPCSGGRPEWHIQGDVLPLLKENWDMIIAFPPCTYLTVTGNRWFNIERYGEKAVQRHKDRESAANFFMALANAGCKKIAIENPVGCMSTQWRRPDQIIHPYFFGDPERKSTCLWLKGLPCLVHKESEYAAPNIVKYKNGKGTDSKWHVETMSLPPKERAKARSKTFPGIAKAMADQWG
jgi:site-specific DNA-cytosine methylase